MFDWLNLGTPFFWCFIAALFFAAAMARGSRRSLGVERWTLVFLYLTGSIVAATAGLFVPGPGKFLDLRLAYFSGATVCIGFFAFRYKLAVGSPLVLLLAMLVTLSGISLRGWLPLHGPSAVIGHVRVFEASAKRLDLEVKVPGGASVGTTVSGTLPSGRLSPIVEVVEFSDDYFFLSSPIFYRLDGVTTSHSAALVHALPTIDGGAVGAPPIIRLPGVVHKTIVGVPATVAALQDYAIELQRTLEARIVENAS